MSVKWRNQIGCNFITALVTLAGHLLACTSRLRESLNFIVSVTMNIEQLYI